MVLSGTPGQVAPLIPSGENGLFSREVFYYKSQIREWIDQFSVDEVDAEKEFHRMGYEWKATIDQLKCRGTITLRLDERQQAAFNDSFVRLFLRARQSNGQEMNSSVVRLAINLVRFMEVVAMLRALEQPELLLPAQGINSDNLKDKIIGGWELHITDDDFAALLTMAEPLYLHATHILSFLPTGEITSRGLSERTVCSAPCQTSSPPSNGWRPPSMPTSPRTPPRHGYADYATPEPSCMASIKGFI